MRWWWLLRLWSISVLLRLLLLLLGAGDALVWRPEVTTPANTILKTREGVWLLDMGISPYKGSSCHVPPLWLAVMTPWAGSSIWYAVPNIVSDLVAATAVLMASTALFTGNAEAHQHNRGEISK
jgi:hypothetical protein